jgi:hypothetical protein
MSVYKDVVLVVPCAVFDTEAHTQDDLTCKCPLANVNANDLRVYKHLMTAVGITHSIGPILLTITMTHERRRMSRCILRGVGVFRHGTGGVAVGRPRANNSC